MMLNPEAVKIAERVLEQCFPGLEPAGRWRWRCEMQNGARVPLTARVEENLLQLSAPPVIEAPGPAELARALAVNRSVPGGVRFALSPSSHGLHLRADLALGDETRLLARLRGAVAGFHEAASRLAGGADVEAAGCCDDADSQRLGDLLATTSYTFTKGSRGEFSVVMPGFGRALRVTFRHENVELYLELARCEGAEEAVARQALTLFLLTAAGSLSVVRPYRHDIAGHLEFGFQVSLPAATAAAEEIDGAVQNLCVAHRRCAREANVLLDRGVAECYLALRNVQRFQTPTHETEE